MAQVFRDAEVSRLRREISPFLEASLSESALLKACGAAGRRFWAGAVGAARPLSPACRVALDVANLLYDELAHLRACVCGVRDPRGSRARSSVSRAAILASLLMALLMEP